MPGLRLPTEPRVPGRFRKPIAVVLTAAVVAVGGYAAFRVATSGESFDPALDPSRTEAPGEVEPALPDGGEGA